MSDIEKMRKKAEKLRAPKPRELPSGAWRCEIMVDGRRISVVEDDPEVAHAKALADYGIGFLDISYGFSGEMDLTAPGDPDLMDIVRAAGAIRKAVDVPVFAVGGIRLPEDAQRVLRETNVDMVDVGRSALVDPEWPNRARRGEKPGKCLDCKVCQWRLDREKCPGRKMLEKEVRA